MAKRAKVKLKIDKAAAAERVQVIFPLLRKLYPQARTALRYSNPLDLLIATILSAQCTDVRVNIVTRDLFRKYKNAADWAKADIKQIEADIRSTGFFRNKAANIKKSCRMIVDKFDGQVPGTMEELLTLAGVGRKTANVLLGNAFNTPGIVCDTHVIRLSRRLGLSDADKDAVKLEFDLAGIVPKKKWGGWTMFSHLLIFHGRNVCKARRPDCGNCVISEYCPAANNPKLW
jgi:endonuclease-3